MLYFGVERYYRVNRGYAFLWPVNVEKLTRILKIVKTLFFWKNTGLKREDNGIITESQTEHKLIVIESDFLQLEFTRIVSCLVVIIYCDTQNVNIFLGKNFPVKIF